MENVFKKKYEQAKRAVKNWWLLLIIGAVLIAVGVVILANPIKTILTLSWFIGIAFIVSGVFQLALALSKNYFMTRGWLIVGSILDIVLGILLSVNVGITVIALPYILAFWIIYHGFMIMGTGFDMSSFNIKGFGWYIAGGILLLIVSTLVMIFPIFGETIIVGLLGFAFIFSGVSSISFSIQLKNLHNQIKDVFEIEK